MITPTTWPSISAALPRMLGNANVACCAVLCARLRYLAARIREETRC